MILEEANTDTDDLDALDAKIPRLNGLVAERKRADSQLLRAQAELGLTETPFIRITPEPYSGMDCNLAKRIVEAMPVVASTSNRLAERLADLIANAKPRSTQPSIKKLVNDNYDHILRGYLAGVSLVQIAEIMTDELKIVVKHGSLRTYFLPMAHEKGDVPHQKRESK